MPTALDKDIFTPKPVPLSDLLGEINTHKAALPNFQRPWVWEPEMVRQLILSVGYRYPAGSLLTMPVKGKAFTLRPFEGSGDTLKDTPRLMVLDGQQRLTSLYQALYRLDGVTVDDNTFHFYLDVAALMAAPSSASQDDDLFEVSLFYVRREKGGGRFRYVGTPPVKKYELTAQADELAAGALPLGCVFDANGGLAEWRNKYLLAQYAALATSDVNQMMALNTTWDTQVKPWLDRIRNYRFPVVELDEDVPLSAICHIFEKVNSTGVALDVFDLCTALLWTENFFLNVEWKKTEKSLKPTMTMQPLMATAFLQSISLLDTLDRKQVASGQAGPRIAVACRKSELLAMKKATYQKWWDLLVGGYKEAASFMMQEGILSLRVMPYSTMIVPLASILTYARHTKGAIHVNAAWPKIRRWYWCSVFSQRYSSQTETISAQDFEQVLAWIGGGPEPDAVRTFTFRSDVLEEINTLKNVIYKGVLCLLASDGAEDFGGNGKLSVNLFFNSRQDHHHIFPTDALKKMGVADPRANTIVNKTLIGSAVNQSIGGNKPSVYIPIRRNKLDPNDSSVFDKILATHRINAALLVSDDWDGFRLDRRERLRQLIEKVCGGDVQPFRVGTPPSAPTAGGGSTSTAASPSGSNVSLGPSAAFATSGLEATDDEVLDDYEDEESLFEDGEGDEGM